MNKQKNKFEKFKQNKNLRQIEKNEIVFDIDNRKVGLEAINFIGVNLYYAGYNFEIWYAEAQKSPHLHIKNIIGLEDLNYEQLKKYKEIFIRKYTPERYLEWVDFSLCAKHLIAKENEKHYKYNTKKELLNIWNTAKSNFAEENLIKKAKKQKEFTSAPLTKFENVKIDLMEKKCLWLQNTIKKKDLSHEERSCLMFIYLKIGEEGEKRLREIMERQEDYSEKKTNYFIERYKKQGKFYGISCRKLIEKRLCKYPECSFYKKAKRKVALKNGISN